MRAGVEVAPEPGIFRTSNAMLRCQDVSRDGVDVEMVNGPYEQMSTTKDPALRKAVVAIVNDWAREFYEESNGRFTMLLPLPRQTPEEAVAKIERITAFGLLRESFSTGPALLNPCCTKWGSPCGQRRRRPAFR